MDLKRLTQWIDLGRSVAALLFIPACCIYASVLVWLLYRLVGDTEAITLKVVEALAISLWGIIGLVALGVMWLQKRQLPDVKINTPGGIEIAFDSNGEDNGQSDAPCEEFSLEEEPGPRGRGRNRR